MMLSLDNRGEHSEQDSSRGCSRDSHGRVRGSIARRCCTPCSAGRAKMIVGEDTTKNGAWAGPDCARGSAELWSNKASLRCSSTLGPREKPCEDVWEGGRQESLETSARGSLDPQAIEQVTISGSSRQGQPEHGNHLRLRALASDDVQAQVEKYLSTIHHQQSRTPRGTSASVDGRKVAELRKLDRSAKGLLIQRRNLKKGTENW